MLSINLTLVIQIINFLMTWLLFDRIFLRAGYDTVMKERLLESDLERDQHLLSEVLNKRIAIHQALIQSEQQQLTQEMPPYGGRTAIIHQDIKEIARLHIEAAEKQQLIRSCKDIMVDQVLNAADREL